MNLTRFVGPTALVIGLTVPALAAAQDGPPPMPKPGPEHALFKMDAGTWDATVEVTMAPGAKPETSKGVEVNTIGCGGLCLITDFKAEMMGMAFLGHGTTTWDVVKKKYSLQLDRFDVAGPLDRRSHLGSEGKTADGLDGRA